MGERIPSAVEVSHWLEVALGVCDEADELSLAGFRRDIRVDTKPDKTLVTEIDRSIESLARDRLRAAFPGCCLVGEEQGTDSGDSSLCWYIDPIDATSNFVRGVPAFATLLAVALDGEVQLGVVSAPALHERWMGWRGGGAWRGERPIAVSRVGRVAESQLLYGSRSDDMRSGLMPGLDATLAQAWRERGFGDFWGYMLVAEGAAEAMVETGAHAWDWAAPLVIIEEAGGRFSTVDGERRFDGASAVATNGLIHDELLARLRDKRGRGVKRGILQ